jgi:hypothetical protein
MLVADGHDRKNRRARSKSGYFRLALNLKFDMLVRRFRRHPYLGVNRKDIVRIDDNSKQSVIC